MTGPLADAQAWRYDGKDSLRQWANERGLDYTLARARGHDKIAAAIYDEMLQRGVELHSNGPGSYCWTLIEKPSPILQPFIDKCNDILDKHAVKPCLPSDVETRNELPMADGCLDYFPLALAYVAHVSWKSTQQHHPDKPMHWDRTKSLDDRNKIMKHLADSGTMDTDGVRHSGKLAWRALANLEKELEAAGWGNPGRASVFPPTTERT